MTPDFLLPGNGPLLQVALGLGDIPTFDIRQQCSGFLYGLGWRTCSSRAAATGGCSWWVPRSIRPSCPGIWAGTPSSANRRGRSRAAERAENTASRDRTVLFGDGAGAVVIEGREGTAGLGPIRLHTDGTGAGVLTMLGPASSAGLS